MQCWLLEPKDRPQFKDLVGRFSGVLERESGYLELSQSLCWKESRSDLPLSPPLAGLPATEDQETAPAENELECTV